MFDFHHQQSYPWGGQLLNGQERLPYDFKVQTVNAKGPEDILWKLRIVEIYELAAHDTHSTNHFTPNLNGRSVIPWIGLPIDYRCADQKKSWRVERRHSIGLDSLFQKTPMFTPKNWTVKPGDSFENTTFLAVVWKCQGLWRSCTSLICETDTTNRFLASSWFR
jgi:hypothetical protein